MVKKTGAADDKEIVEAANEVKEEVAAQPGGEEIIKYFQVINNQESNQGFQGMFFGDTKNR